MLNNNAASSKHAFAKTGVTGLQTLGNADGYTVSVETKLRLITRGFTGANVITVWGRLISDSTWVSVGTITGATSATLDISLVDVIKYEITTVGGTGDLFTSAFIFY